MAQKPSSFLDIPDTIRLQVHGKREEARMRAMKGFHPNEHFRSCDACKAAFQKFAQSRA